MFARIASASKRGEKPMPHAGLSRTAMTLVALFGAGLLGACAVQEPPPGGPLDEVPPSIVSTVPREDSAGVARDVSPRFVFNERVDPASFKNRITVYPPVEFERLRVKGERLEITFRDLLPETTICVLVRPGVKDYHRIESRRNFMLFFSTADSIDRGEVSGVVRFKEKPDSAGVAELFAVEGDSAVELRSASRARVAFAGRDGSFRFRALPTDRKRFVLRGFIDTDGDGRYGEEKEFAALRPDTIVLDLIRPSREDIVITVIDPNEPGSVEGVIINETPFSDAATIRLAPSARGASAMSGRADSTGAFLLAKVPPGSYTLTAFIDIEPDTLCGTYRSPADSTATMLEPCVALPDTLRIGPGESRKLDPITLK